MRAAGGVRAVGVALLLLALAACAVPLKQADLGLGHPLTGRIWQPATQTFIPDSQAQRLMIAADYVLLGEKHDNSVHHHLQAEAVRTLIRAGGKPAIVFEMINTGQRAALDDFRSSLRQKAEYLGNAIDWQKTGWPDWRYYAPIADAALKAKLAIVPANFPRAKIRELGRTGYAALDAEFVTRLGLETPLPKALDAALMEEMYLSHCKMMPRQHLGAVARIQRARDALMAAALAKYNKAVLIAGGGHTRKDRGAPWYLRHLKPAATILSVGYVEIDAETTDPAAYAEIYGAARLPFDLVWFTPRLDTADPCEKFAPQLKKMRQKSG